MKFWTERSPSDWTRWEAMLAEGMEPSEAAHAQRQTCSSFKRSDSMRHAAALPMSRRVRAVRRAEVLNPVREEAGLARRS